MLLSTYEIFIVKCDPFGQKILIHFFEKFNFSLLFYKIQHLVSLITPFCVDQCQSDWVGSDFLHQSQLLMSAHLEKTNSPQVAHPNVHLR